MEKSKNENLDSKNTEGGIIEGEFTVLDSSSTKEPDYVIDIPYSRNPEEENFALKDAVEVKVRGYLEIEKKLDFYKDNFECVYIIFHGLVLH